MTDIDESWVATLSRDGRQAAEAAAAIHTRYGLTDLVDAWHQSVHGIVSDTGEDYYDDYWIYLGWRDIITEVVAVLSDADAAVINSVVQPIDEQFKAHTIDDGGRAMSRKFTVNADLWYWRRIPVSGPIARSLQLE